MKEKTILFESSGVPHLCVANPYDVNESVMNFSRKFHTIYKFKIPIWCSICEVAYRPDTVCSHIILRGYKEGKDNITYFSDSMEAKENREKRKLEMQEQKTDPTSRTEDNLQSF